MANSDKSNGYEEIAPAFIAERGRNSSGVGASVVADWSHTLPSGATVLDLGCGTGIPISKVLIERGLTTFQAFRKRRPPRKVFFVGVGPEPELRYSATIDNYSLTTLGCFFLETSLGRRYTVERLVG